MGRQPTADEIQRRIDKLAEWQKYSNVDLKHIFENGGGIPFDGIRKALSSDSEQRILDAFYGGLGRTVLFNENDAVSIKLDANPTFRSYFSKFVNRIKPLIDQNDFSNITNTYVLDNETSVGIGLPNFSVVDEIPGFDYFGLMGRVQRIEIETQVVEVTHNVPIPPYTNNSFFPSSIKRILKMTFTMRDWFGADWEDLAPAPTDIKRFSTSLKGFFMLQHFQSGYRPFETVIKHRTQFKI